MASSAKEKQDELRSLPSELRERVYLFAGFPVARHWYHACEGRIVLLISMQFADNSARYGCKIEYKNVGNEHESCSTSKCPITTNLMATNKQYYAELAELLYKDSHTDFQYSVGMHSYSKEHFVDIMWRSREQKGNFSVPYHMLTYVSVALVTKLTLTVDAPVDWMIGKTVPEAIQLASAIAPLLEHLAIRIKINVVLREVARGREDVTSKLVATHICRESSLRTFRVSLDCRTTGEVGLLEAYHRNVSRRFGGCCIREIAFELTSLPSTSRMELIEHVMSCLLVQPAAIHLNRLSLNESTSNDEDVRQGVKLVGDENRAEELIAAIDSNAIKISDSIRESPGDLVRVYPANQTSITHNCLNRQVSSWNDWCTPMWTEWKVVTTETKYCPALSIIERLREQLVQTQPRLLSRSPFERPSN